MSIENQATCLANDTSGLDHSIKEAIEAGKRMLEGEDVELETDSDFFYKHATRIVEPRGLEDDEDYNNLQENDPDNWVGFVANTCGADWGVLAKIVTEYGY